MSKSQKTLLFAALLVSVLGTFVYLGAQPGARPMPSHRPGLTEEVQKAHRLRINLRGELLGVETDPMVDMTQASVPGFALDKKAAEGRVNKGCVACHTSLSDTHPSKTECIKCHRMGSR